MDTGQGVLYCRPCNGDPSGHNWSARKGKKERGGVERGVWKNLRGGKRGKC